MASRVSFPHPVLGNSDDVAGGFSASTRYCLAGPSVDISTAYSLENPTIEALIEDGSARYASRIQCGRTYYRRTFLSAAPRREIREDAEVLSGTVIAYPMVIAVKPLREYRPEGLHPDYGDATFDLRKGEVLARGAPSSFLVLKDFDPLTFHARSIIQVTQGTQEKGPAEVIFDEDLIVVQICKEDWHAYQQAKGQAAEVLAASLAFPAVVQGISLMRREEYSERPWAAVLTHFVNRLELPNAEEEAVEVAQRLLGLPVSRALRRIEQILQEEFE